MELLFLVLTLYPEIQRKAQEEIDRVVGHNRLPEFQDIESLPFVRAIVMELLRWQPVTPLGMCVLVHGNL
jgi:cytochrome P450